MKYHIRSISVDAIQYNGLNKFDICEFCKGTEFDAQFDYDPQTDKESIFLSIQDHGLFLQKNDYLVKMEDGIFTVYSKESFEKTYIKAE